MTEINLLDRYPRSQRPIEERGSVITEEIRRVARQYGEEFFDGDRLYGYGGYSYDGRWVPIAERIRDYYGLTGTSTVLDIGCAKGFLMHDLEQVVPGLRSYGVDVSHYAIHHGMEEVKPRLAVADASRLPFPDDSFDVVLSINSLHNLPAAACRESLREVMRVSRGQAFVTVDAWRDEPERQRLMQWMLTAETYMSVDDWKQFFGDAGYTGDFYWFFP
ncbi:MAG: class I SAM-dependent methyltransferase [Planctomycetota bacterium]